MHGSLLLALGGQLGSTGFVFPLLCGGFVNVVSLKRLGVGLLRSNPIQIVHALKILRSSVVPLCHIFGFLRLSAVFSEPASLNAGGF
jgi:hypothetical protein